MDRKELLKKRSQIKNRKEKEKAIANWLLPFLRPFARVGSYLPIGSELRPPQLDVLFLIPKVLNETEMIFTEPVELQKGPYGLMQSASDQEAVPQAVLVPLLGFQQTNRIGYGKGYYDRYLAKHPEILTIGLAFDEQECEFQPAEWDIPLDILVTPSRILTWSKLHEHKKEYTRVLD